MITASKDEAVAQIEGWADEAESGNYHGLCAALSELAGQVANYRQRGDLPYVIWTVKSIDEADPADNIAHIAIL